MIALPDGEDIVKITCGDKEFWIVNAHGAVAYTPRQAVFVALVAEHSGYFVRRQWLTFSGLAHGHRTVEFFAALMARGHVQAAQYGRQTHVYHVVSRPLYAAMDEEHNRHRRQLEPSTITQKLMTLDLVLAYRDRVWYGTEREKVALFTSQYGVDRARLPAKTYQARRGSEPVTVRHFVEKFPVSVEPPSSIVTLTYISGGERTADGFTSFLRAYAPLIAELPAVVVLYVSGGRDWGDAARVAFSHRYGRDGEVRHPVLASALAQHFRARQRLEAGDLAGVPPREVDDLRAQLARFRGPAYDRLYHAWQHAGAMNDVPVKRSDPTEDAVGSPPAIEEVERRIFLVRGRRVMVDIDLASRSISNRAAKAIRRTIRDWRISFLQEQLALGGPRLASQSGRARLDELLRPDIPVKVRSRFWPSERGPCRVGATELPTAAAAQA